jgi:hypothetical protein
MKTKVYICKFDDSIVLAKKLEIFKFNDLYLTSKISDLKDLYKITKLYRTSNRRKPYIVDYIVRKEYFKVNYVYIGEF